MLISFLAYSTTLKIEVTRTSNILIDFWWTTWLYIPEDRTLDILTCFNNILKKRCFHLNQIWLSHAQVFVIFLFFFKTYVHTYNSSYAIWNNDIQVRIKSYLLIKRHFCMLWLTKIVGMLTEIQQEILWRTDRLLSLIQHSPHRKWYIQQFFYCCMCIHCHGNIWPSHCPATIGGFLLSHCLPTRGEYTYRHINWWEGFMKYTAEA
jgi:hypothetical protein